jgi:hypothetical protein
MRVRHGPGVGWSHSTRCSGCPVPGLSVNRFPHVQEPESHKRSGNFNSTDGSDDCVTWLVLKLSVQIRSHESVVMRKPFFRLTEVALEGWLMNVTLQRQKHKKFFARQHFH